MKSYFFSILVFLFFQFGFSQNYRTVDSITSLYPKTFKSIDALAERIESDFNEDKNKVRALFYWLSENIEYDYSQKDDIYQKQRDKYNFGQHLYNKNRRLYAEKCLMNNKAMCSGYALIFKYTLDILQIENEYIIGTAKTQIRDIGVTKNKTNHAWNAVKIDKKWHLLDVTWSTNEKENNFNHSYFFVKPENMILNHFPEEKKWQLIKKPISKSNFTFKPLIYSSYFNSGLKLNSNTSGLIKARYNTYIKIEFESYNPKIQYRYAFSNDEFSTPLNFIKKRGTYLATILNKSKKRNTLTIFGEGRGLLGFKIIPSK